MWLTKISRPQGLAAPNFSKISAPFMDIPSWRSVKDFTGKLFWLLSASNIHRPGIKSSSTEIWTIKIHSTGLIHTVTRLEVQNLNLMSKNRRKIRNKSSLIPENEYFGSIFEIIVSAHPD